MPNRVSLRTRLLPLIVVAALGVAALLRWSFDDTGTDGGALLVYAGVGVLLLGGGAIAHLLAVRHPERYALDGLAWTLTIVSVVTIGMLSLAMLGSFGR